MNSLSRLFKLLELDKKDISQIFFYAIFAGIISLSLPLGIQAIINFIQSGRVSASWIVLVILVVIGVALVGILSLMQLRITENLQQKMFVRSSFEFASRIPRIEFKALYQHYPPELANRFFDTLTIQKGTSKLLVDFSAAILQIIFGVILLSLYHPFFMAFGILLLLLLYVIFKFSFNIGVQTSLKTSKNKYKAAAWLQEIARNNFSFRNELNYDFALEKNNGIVQNYLINREKHFGVIKKQFSHLIIFKVLITASLLIIGGYLVLNQQMNIGQFVASEIIILLVITSIEKIILGLETFYDVITAVEKIGQVSDMELEQQFLDDKTSCYSNISIKTENLGFRFPDANYEIITGINIQIESAEKIIINGNNGSGKTTLIRILSGLLQPTSGNFIINDDTFRKINLLQYRERIGSIIQGETPFEGTILENITFNDATITTEDLKWALISVQLSDYVKSLPNGLNTKIFPEGKQLTSSNAQKILLARSIIRRPCMLFFEDPTDKMDDEAANKIIDFITDKEHKWTVIVSSKNPYWNTKCTRQITMQKGSIVSDLKK